MGNSVRKRIKKKKRKKATTIAVSSKTRRGERLTEDWSESFERITVIRSWDTNEIHVSLFRASNDQTLFREERRNRYEERKVNEFPTTFNYDYSCSFEMSLWRGGHFRWSPRGGATIRDRIISSDYTNENGIVEIRTRERERERVLTNHTCVINLDSCRRSLSIT